MANITTGSTRHFKRTEAKDGAVWNLTGAAVTFKLRKPDNTVLTFVGSVLDGTAGIVQYVQADTAVFDVPGNWSRSWLISLGGVVDTTPPISFTVTASP